MVNLHEKAAHDGGVSDPGNQLVFAGSVIAAYYVALVAGADKGVQVANRAVRSDCRGKKMALPPLRTAAIDLALENFTDYLQCKPVQPGNIEAPVFPVVVFNFVEKEFC